MNNSFDDPILPGEQEKLLQFQDLTGIEDIARCRDILTRNGWDMEVAFQEEMNLREGRPSMYATETRPPAVINDRFLQQIFTTSVPTPPPQGFGGLIGYVVNLVFNFCYNTFSSILTTILDIFRGPERIVTDPLGDVMKFIQNFNERITEEHPVFYQGTYSQALNDAKRELKFLLVFLHADNQPESMAFCRDTLSNPEVIEYINRNMILWGCDISTPEGFRVSHSIGSRNLPNLVVICLRNNKMVVVGRSEGNCNAAELLRRLRSVVQENEIYLIQTRADRLERSMNQSIRQQQDAAYEQSLRADQEKERRKQEEREAARRAEEEIERQRLAEQQRKVDLENMKLELAMSVPSEPAADATNVVNLVFKLPTGKRLERRFLSSHSLGDIFNYIFCHPDAPDSFEITANFPKRVLISDSTKDDVGTNSIDAAGLKNREVLFINDLDA